MVAHRLGRPAEGEDVIQRASAAHLHLRAEAGTGAIGFVHVIPEGVQCRNRVIHRVVAYDGLEERSGQRTRRLVSRFGHEVVRPRPAGEASALSHSDTAGSLSIFAKIEAAEAFQTKGFGSALCSAR